jgi:hypothetical protein
MHSSNILDLGARWRVVSFTHKPLYPWRYSPHYPMYTRVEEVGGSQNQSELYVPLQESETDSSVVQPLT